jgi:hypothetical protein
MQFNRRFITTGLFTLMLFGAGFALPAEAQYPGLSDPAMNASGSEVTFGPVTTTVDGGSIPLGATAQVVIRFKNEGSQPIESGFVRLYPSSTVSAAVSMNQCELEPLPGGAECAVALSVKALQSGSWRLEMLMSHSGRSRLVAATVSGEVAASVDGADSLSNDIESSPGEVDFGTLTDSQPLVESVVLRNVTSSPLEIKDIYIDSGVQSGFGLKTDCSTLQAGEGCIAIVSWSPKLAGRSSGVLVIRHSGPAGLSSVPLAGQYNPNTVNEAEIYPRAVPGKGLLVSSQSLIDFGEDVATASTITVSLVNAGDAPISLKDVKIAGADNGLDFKGEGCKVGTVLEPVEACPLTVQWSPTRVGEIYDDIQVSHDGARGVLVLPVRGDAIGTVSQDQKAIVISGDGAATQVISDVTVEDIENSIKGDKLPLKSAPTTYSAPTSSNPAAALDGYRITSFSPTRAIINGPGGSRIVFNSEETVLGGIPWYVSIQANGIEFINQSQRILLLFDRSLSSINRVNATNSPNNSSGSSNSNSGSSSGSSSNSSSSDNDNNDDDS